MVYRVYTFLAPNMLPFYQYTVDYLSRSLNLPIQLIVGQDYGELVEADFCFICGLPYVLRNPPYSQPSLRALAALILTGERYAGKPIYFSDVIVAGGSSFQSFADLRGCSWAFNEPESQSGYGITRYHLVQQGETRGYFGKMIQAGFHQKAIRLVAAGRVDAAAIDSHTLAIEIRDHPELAAQIRVIDALGPSTIQPFAATMRVPETLAREVQEALAVMHHDAEAKLRLQYNLITRFTAVADTDYDDIRAMLAACEKASFLTLC